MCSTVIDTDPVVTICRSRTVALLPELLEPLPEDAEPLFELDEPATDVSCCADG